MDNHTWKSNHFKRIFLTIYISTTTLLTAALFLMYFTSSYLNLHYLNSVMSKFIGSTYAGIDYQMTTSQKNVLNASLSPAGISLFSRQTNTIYDELNALRSVDYFLSQDPFLHSVFFYNHTTDKIYMLGNDLTAVDLDDFFDQEIVQQIHSGTILHAQNLPREILGSPYSSSYNRVLTSAYRLGNNNIAIVNLDIDAIFTILHNDPAIYSNTATNYFVYHGRSQRIYHSLFEQELSFMSDDLVNALNSHDWKNAFNAFLHGTSYHFNVLEDPVRNLQIVSVIRQSDVSASFFVYFLPFLLIVIVISLIAAFVNLKISSQLYSPIAQIKRTLSEYHNDNEENHQAHEIDEVDYIKQRIIDSTNRLESLFSYKAKSISISQESFLKNQLLYNKYSNEEFWTKCTQVELPYYKGNSFILIYAQWFSISETVEEDAGSQGLLSFALSNVIHELFDSNVHVQDLPFDKDGIAFLFCFQNHSTANINNTILKDIQTIFEQHLDLRLSFFISESFTEPIQLYPKMQRLQELSNYQFFCKGRCILRSEELDTAKLLLDICPSPDISALESSIRSTDETACRKLLDDYFQKLPQYTRDAANTSIHVFASKIITMFKRIEATCLTFPLIFYQEFYNAMSTAHTISQTQDLITDQIVQVIHAIAVANCNSMGIDSTKVIRYLQENHQDFTLSSKSVAQHFRISVPYLNRIFKQQTGISISAYIKKLRLEHATQLLRTTTHPVEHIAKVVGFENTKYFYSLFKNEFGVSPSSYRNVRKNHF